MQDYFIYHHNEPARNRRSISSGTFAAHEAVMSLFSTSLTINDFTDRATDPTPARSVLSENNNDEHHSRIGKECNGISQLILTWLNSKSMAFSNAFI